MTVQQPDHFDRKLKVFGDGSGAGTLPSFYLGSLNLDSDPLADMPKRVKDYAPNREPSRPKEGYAYRVAEPFYPPESVQTVTEALAEGDISSGSQWPTRMAQKICQYFGVPVAFPTSSGFSALHVALLACNLNRGDLVLVPSMTMVAVANTVKLVGATPVYCDCAPNSVNPHWDQYLEKATPKVRAIIVTHTFGVPVKGIDLIAKECEKRSWILIEDICESLGSEHEGRKVGTFGSFACASLYANKIITAGDGGWIMSKDIESHDRLKSLINHGFNPGYHFLHFEMAPNAKINGLGAALVVPAFDYLPTLLARKQSLVKLYRRLFGEQCSQWVTCMESCEQDAPWVFGIEVSDQHTRTALRDHLAACGVETRNYFFPLHLEPINYLQGTATYEVVLPEAERLGTTGLYLPSHWYVQDFDAEYVVRCVRFFGPHFGLRFPVTLVTFRHFVPLRSFFDQSEPGRPPRQPGWVNAARKLPVDRI